MEKTDSVCPYCLADLKSVGSSKDSKGYLYCPKEERWISPKEML